MVNFFIGLGVFAAILAAAAVAGYQYYSSKTVRDGFTDVSEEAKENKDEILEAIRLTNTEKEELKKHYLGIIEEKDEDIGIAKEKIEELLSRIEEFENSDNEIIKKAFTLFINKKYDDAIGLLDDELIKRQEKELSEIIMMKADLQIVKFEIPEALSNMEKAVEIFPSPTNKIKLNSLYEKTNNYNKALKNYEDLIELNPTELDDNLKGSIYQNMAVIYTSQNKLEKARHSIQKSIEYQNSNNTEENSLSISSKVNSFANLSNINFREGDFKGSLENINKAISLQNSLVQKEGKKHKMKEIGQSLNKAIILSEMGQVNEALQIYNRIPDEIIDLGLNHQIFNPDTEIQSLIGRSNLYHKIGMYDLSIKDNNDILLLIGDVIEYNPFHFEYQKGKVHINLGNSHKEKKEFKQAEDNISKGIEIYEKYYSKDPERFKVEYFTTIEALAALYLAQSEFQNALTKLELLKTEYGTNFKEGDPKYLLLFVRLYFNLGCAHHGLNQVEKAKTSFLKSIKYSNALPNKDSPFIQAKINDMKNRIIQMGGTPDNK